MLYDVDMKYTSIKICLVIAALFGGVAGASDLPICPSDTNVRWHNCFGTITLLNGRKYVGEFKDGKRTGQGTFTYLDGHTYVGEFKDGKRTGQGTFTFLNGEKYVGEWKDDIPNGQGTYTFLNGKKYVGEFKDGKPNGQGTETYLDGSTYVGEFKDGNLNGQGTYTWSNGNTHVGEFKDGKRTGQGTFTWSDGNTYVGEFKDGNLNGQGTFTLLNGRKYVGEFKDGKPNGQGTETYLDGSTYVGEFKDGNLNGQGTYTWSDGKVKEGIWKDGEFQHAKALTKPVPVVKTPSQDDQTIPASSGSGKDDSLSPEHLMESGGYGLLAVDTNEGVFLDTQINFNDFVGGSCASMVSKLRKSKSKDSYVFQLLSFNYGSGETLVGARANFVRGDCVPKTIEKIGVKVPQATKICEGMEKAYKMRILGRNDDGLVTELQSRSEPKNKTSLGYDNLDAGFVSGRTFATKQQIDLFGWEEYWDDEYIVCVKSE